ncbi:MAG: DUF4339 domain-containing protein [Pirellulales bacterium]|nr:DUF4339 domain-containing protein [Pirellulales bacterium]
MLVWLFIMCSIGGVCAAIANSKGRSGVGWFFVGFFFGLIAIIIVACLSNLKEERAHRQHVENSNRRLREQLQQERIKNQAFHQHTLQRLDTHDNQLGVNTRPTNQIAYESDPMDFLQQLEGNSSTSDELVVQPMSPPAPPTQTSRRQWHYEEGGQTLGPVSESELLSLFRSGRLHDATLIWTEQLGEWKQAGQIEGLQKVLRS